MSVSAKTLTQWRARGSLRYLARKLKVSTKQIARYCDNGWVRDFYRTPKGHRRIRCTATIAGRIGTVEHVVQCVSWAKETNLQIRYASTDIDWFGTIIPVTGCNSMHDLYKRALKAGLSDRDARDVAYRPNIKSVPSRHEAALDTLWALRGTSAQEVGENRRKFGCLPLDYLLDADDTEVFRARAEEVWQGIVADHKSREEWDSSPDNRRRDERRETLETLRVLLSQPDVASFVSELSKATEMQDWRGDDDAATFERLNEQTPDEARATRLQTAALRLKHRQQSPSAAALARALGISRPALYRVFGVEEIRAALNLVRNDPLAIREARNHMLTKGKKLNRVAGTQDV